MKKALAKELNERYDKTYMSKDTRKELKQTLNKLDKGRKEGLNNTETLDYEALNHTFTPYKLRLVEKSQRLHHNPTYLRHMLRKAGDKKTDADARMGSIENISEAIQAKAVLKNFRNMHSACSRYSLINQNP